MARVTSQLVDTEFDIAIEEWQEAGLLKISHIRLHKFATIAKILIDRRLGKLSENDLKKVEEKLVEIYSNL